MISGCFRYTLGETWGLTKMLSIKRSIKWKRLNHFLCDIVIVSLVHPSYISFKCLLVVLWACMHVCGTAPSLSDRFYGFWETMRDTLYERSIFSLQTGLKYNMIALKPETNKHNFNSWSQFCGSKMLKCKWDKILLMLQMSPIDNGVGMATENEIYFLSFVMQHFKILNIEGGKNRQSINYYPAEVLFSLLQLILESLQFCLENQE